MDTEGHTLGPTYDYIRATHPKNKNYKKGVDKMSVFAGAIKERTGSIKDEAKVRQFKWCFL